MISDLTILIPNYNHQKYLTCALNGIFSQTCPATTVILIDDASTDNSRMLIKSILKKHPGVARTTVNYIENSDQEGVVAATMRGLELARTEFIAFLAADDFIDPEFVAQSIKLLRKHKEAAFCSACAQVQDENNRVTGLRPLLRPAETACYIAPDHMRKLLTKGDNFFVSPVTIYRRSMLLQAGGFLTELGSTADGSVLRRLSVRHGFVFLPRIMGAWRIHGQNYSSQTMSQPDKVDELIVRNLESFASEPAGSFPANYDKLYERRIRFNAAHISLPALANDPAAALLLTRLIKGSKPDMWVFRALHQLGKRALFAGLIWITLRTHPFSYRWMLQEGLKRLAGSRRDDL